MAYFMKLTAVGLAKIAAAQTGGPAVSLTHIAVGDGNGNPVPSPTGTETAMAHEVHREQLNSLSVASDDNTTIMAEMVIPSDKGGFAIHEIGVFDATGALFAYGNFPATYKPLASQGSTRDMVILAAMKVGNAAVINLVIDTSIALATRPWVLATITAAFLLPGGTTHQVLRKKSNADGDTEWADATAAVNITVDVVKEIQTAAGGQDVFNLAVCSTDGVAVYVEGSREFEFEILNQTRLKLASGLPAGTRVLFVQNEPNEPLRIRRIASGRAYFMGQFV